MTDRRTVLLVEDNDDDAELTLKMLGSRVAREQVDWDVHRVRTLKEALDWPGADPEAVLLDLGLPDAGKPERLARHVVDRFEAAAVVLLTGGDDRALAQRCFAIGAQDFVHKHVIREKALTDLLVRAIARHAAARKSLEDSRADMAIDPEMLIRTVNQAVDAAVSRLVVPKLRKVQAAVGAEDTGVIRLSDGTFEVRETELPPAPPPMPLPPARASRQETQWQAELDELRDKVEFGEATRADRRRIRALERKLKIPSPIEQVMSAHPIASMLSKFVLAITAGTTTAYALARGIYDTVLSTEDRVERIEQKLDDVIEDPDGYDAGPP